MQFRILPQVHLSHLNAKMIDKTAQLGFGRPVRARIRTPTGPHLYDANRTSAPPRLKTSVPPCLVASPSPVVPPSPTCPLPSTPHPHCAPSPRISNEKIFHWKDLLQHGAMRDVNMRSITCLQHQNKSTITSE
jgi:hypothetical protein